MAKEILFDTDKLAAGVDKLANAVKITMGPKGRTVVIDKSYGAPVATKDGVTVAKAVSLKDPTENIGARMIQEVAKKAGDDAGDGTTTATVLAQKIVREGRRVIAAGMNPMDIKRGIDLATGAVVADIESHARPVKNSAEIAQVATISANGDAEIGQKIADAMERIVIFSPIPFIAWLILRKNTRLMKYIYCLFAFAVLVFLLFKQSIPQMQYGHMTMLLSVFELRILANWYFIHKQLLLTKKTKL